MSLLLASMIVAFIAGLIALAMPCCFSVLLPSYFASSFKRRVDVLSMTIVFGAGIAIILLPIAFGASYVASFIGGQHSLLFTIGGSIMIVIGIWTLWGRYMLPQPNVPVNLERSDVPSVFTLGVFSGVATSCCAPVLAGIIVLTTLSASLLESLAVGVAYIFGMIFPLLLTALIWDKYRARANSVLQGRMIQIKLGKLQTEMHSSKLIAGVIFIGMGAVTVSFGLTDTMLPSIGVQWVNIYLGAFERMIVDAVSSQGVEVIAAVVIALSLGLFFRALVRDYRGQKKAKKMSASVSSEQREAQSEKDSSVNC